MSHVHPHHQQRCLFPQGGLATLWPIGYCDSTYSVDMLCITWQPFLKNTVSLVTPRHHGNNVDHVKQQVYRKCLIRGRMAQNWAKLLDCLDELLKQVDMQDELDAILESITHSKHEDQEAKPSRKDREIRPEAIFSATLKDLIKASAGKSVCEVLQYLRTDCTYEQKVLSVVLGDVASQMTLPTHDIIDALETTGYGVKGIVSFSRHCETSPLVSFLLINVCAFTTYQVMHLHVLLTVIWI